MKNIIVITLYILGIPFFVNAQNNCLDFDASNEYVDCSTNVGFDNPTTIEAWVMPSAKSGVNTILSKKAASFSAPGYALYINTTGTSDGKIVFETEGASIETSTSVALDKWQHIAVVLSATTGVIYLDGVLQPTVSDAVTLNSSPEKFIIGAFESGSSSFFNGCIDEVRLWSDARTERELKQSMHQELNGNEAGLIAYYNLDEASGAVVDNIQGSSTLDGTLINMGDVNRKTSPAFSGPKSCLAFDGSNDYVDISAISHPNTFSYEAWIYPQAEDGNIYEDRIHQSDRAFYIENNQLVFGWWKGTPDTLRGGTIVQNAWNHVAGIWDGSSRKLYLNGVLVAEDAPAAPTVYAYNDQNWTAIGRADNGSGWRGSLDSYFIGKIDEVRIWEGGRTRNEIRENMSQVLSGDEVGLTAYYNFDNNSGLTLPDYSGNNRDGSLTNMSENWASSTAFNTWLNVTNSNWETATNWSRESVPTVLDNVGVPNYSGANSPIIKVSEEVSCHTLTINSDASLIVKSDASETGSLIVAGSSYGELTFERYINTADEWHYVSSPVVGQLIDDDFMTANKIYSPNGGTNYNFYRYDEDEDYWITYGSAGNPEPFNDMTFVTARGYAITCSDAVITEFVGSVMDEDVDYPVTSSLLDGHGFNLVGNPYTSAIGINASSTSSENFLAQNSDLLEDSYEAIYLWDEQSAYEGDRNDYKIISNNPIAGYSCLSQNYVQPGQAFMVRVVSDGDIGFNKTMQEHASCNFYKETAATWPAIELIVENEALYNSTSIGFNGGMTLGLDPSFDIGKMKGNPNIALYTRLIEDNGVDFAIQALPSNNSSEYVIPVGVDVLEETDISFSISTTELDETEITLEDRQNGQFINLKSEHYYTTVSESGIGRFFLRIGAVNAVESQVVETTISAYFSGDNLTIVNPDSQKNNYQLVDIQGRVVLNGALNGSKVETKYVNLPAGIYVLNVLNSLEQGNLKLVKL